MMSTKKDDNNPDLKEDLRIEGYHLKRKVRLAEIDAFLYLLEHEHTGARYAHISRNDQENTFGVAFKTVPGDSTGVAHILEHTVLCGSEKFPIRDPFFSMLKRSLSTFMNAFTSSDWTMYPFSTQNKTDFYNLMDVYLDSAFYPNIDQLSFKQEGHRLEIDTDSTNANGIRLVYKGVVYNEMRGAMSSPNQVMVRSILNALYPSTTYRFNSGGDPAVIPSLTYEQLKAFHRRYYHPSNAFFYTYGDLPLKGHLDFINEKVLARFKRIDPKSDVPSQPRWQRPKTATYSYPLDKNEDPSKKCQVCSAWLTADIKDTYEVLALTLLGQILLGNPASPLRKALIDSNLGSALCDGSGYDADNRDTMFVCGLKDVEASTASRIETIVLEVLNTLAEQGVDHALIDGAIHQLEFHRKEITNTPYPYGIKLLLAFAGNWFHGGDPARVLQFDDDLSKLRDEISKGRFFERKIKQYLLHNPHRVRLTLVPDQSMAQQERARIAAELADIGATLSENDLNNIQKDTETLRQLQEQKEDISCLPTLALSEISPKVHSISPSTSYKPVSAVCYEQPTSGIFYFSAVAGSGLLAKPLLPLVPLFCHAFSKIGTSIRDYTDMARLMDATTGGIRCSCHARTCFDQQGGCLPLVSFNGKCLLRNQEKMFEIIEELLCKFDFSDIDRLQSLLLEYRAGLESMIIQNGHRLAMSLAARNFSITCSLSETWHGIHQLQTIKRLTEDLSKNRLNDIAEKLFIIAQHLLTSGNLTMALIGEGHAIAGAASSIATIQAGLHKRPEASVAANGFVEPEVDVADHMPREGWGTASAVSFVASTFRTVRLEHRDAPALSVISKMLRSLYLHREIREKGGAYGGFAIYDSENGLFHYGSYRDPHIVSTLKTYDNAQKFITSGDYGKEDVKEAILQVCSDIDKPDPPGIASRKAFNRSIISLTDEMRNRFKSKLLALTRNKIVDTANIYFGERGQEQAVAVISSEKKLTAANEKLLENPLKLYSI